MSGFCFDPSGDAHSLVVEEKVLVRGEERTVRRAYQRGSGGEPAGVGFVLDSDFPVCMVCCRDFTLFFRRHHCRACGNVVCSLCSPFEAAGQRVCVQCFYGQSPRHTDSQKSFFASSGDSDEEEDCSQPQVLPQLQQPPPEAVAMAIPAPAPSPGPEDWVSVEAVRQFIAERDYDEDTVLELRGAYLQLVLQSAYSDDGRHRVSLADLYQWAPLADALSSNIISCADIIRCYDSVFGESVDASRSETESPHVRLSFAQFVQLAFALQALIDEHAALSALATGPEPKAKPKEAAFAPDAASLRHFEQLLAAAAAADGPSPARRPSLFKASSEMSGMSCIEPAEDRESSILNLKMKTFVGNAHKQDMRRASKWRVRRVLLSGLVLSYYSGHDQKGAFSLKGEGTRVVLGRAYPAAQLEGYDTSSLPRVGAPAGPVCIVSAESAIAARLGMEPHSFAVYSADGHYANFFVDSSSDAEHWVEVIAFNLDLNAKITTHNAAFNRSRIPQRMPSILEGEGDGV